LLQVLFALGDHPFYFAEQMGNADLVVEFFGNRDFEVLNFAQTDGWICQVFNQ